MALAVALVGGGVAVAVTWPQPSFPAAPAVTAPSAPAGSAAACSPGTAGDNAQSGEGITTATASLGPVSATVVGPSTPPASTSPPSASSTFVEDFITIRSGGPVLVRAPITAPAQATAVQFAGLTGSVLGGGVLCIARFPGQATSTVLLGLFTGGAHCCVVVRAWRAAHAAPPVDENLGNAPAEVTESPTGAEIVTTDNAFYYAFTDYASSGAPVLVQSFSGSRFVNVTAQHHDLVQADADRWFGLYEAAQQPQSGERFQDGQGGLGDLAAWAGDECTLAVQGEPWSTLSALEAQDQLVGPAGGIGPTGPAFIAQLRAFLPGHGYCTT